MQPLYEYVCHMKGHRNSDGELAEWVIKSHETGKILSSHKSEKKAKEHLQQMHIFGESVEGEAACSHCGWSADGVEEYNGRLLCPYCLTQFKWLDEHRDPENGTYEKYDLVPRESNKSNKLIGESTYGNDMDKRIKIFMEGVSQLGLSKNQVDAIGKITNICMEGMEDGDFGAADLGAPPDFGGPSPERDAMEEHQLDQVYDELWKLGVPTDTINARGRAKDFSFNTMYQLLKEVCNFKGVPVPEIVGVEDNKTSLSDLGGDGDAEEPAEF